MKNETPCKQTECRMFIDFKEEYNCTLVSIWENGPMTLRQIGERIGVSFARIKQIETKALKKMRKNRLLM
tara:strand:- start:196 stop:405 length:210 start_codon:yes stop_codon:yes gene_type:complete